MDPAVDLGDFGAMRLGRVAGWWAAGVLLVAIMSAITHGDRGSQALVSTSQPAIDVKPASTPSPGGDVRVPSTTTTTTTTTTLVAPAVTVTSTTAAPANHVPPTTSPPSTIVDERCVSGVRHLRDGCQWRPFELTGTTTYPDGRAAPNVCLGHGAPFLPIARSDTQGRWHGYLPGPDDTVVLEVSDCGTGDPLGVITESVGPFQLSLDAPTRIDIEVNRLSGVIGIVVDADANPVPGVCVASGGRQDLPPVRTGPDGAFALGHIEPGTAQVWAHDCPEDLDGGFGVVGHFSPPQITTTAGEWTTVSLHVVMGTGR